MISKRYPLSFINTHQHIELDPHVNCFSLFIYSNTNTLHVYVLFVWCHNKNRSLHSIHSDFFVVSFFPVLQPNMMDDNSLPQPGLISTEDKNVYNAKWNKLLEKKIGEVLQNVIVLWDKTQTNIIIM